MIKTEAISIILSLLISFSIFAQQPCNDENLRNLTEEILESGLQSSISVLEESLERENLLSAKITHSALDVGVGNANIYLNTSNGAIVDLNVRALVGLLGVNSEIIEKNFESINP